jgi:hypothetical protein
MNDTDDRNHQAKDVGKEQFAIAILERTRFRMVQCSKQNSISILMSMIIIETIHRFPKSLHGILSQQLRHTKTKAYGRGVVPKVSQRPLSRSSQEQ